MRLSHTICGDPRKRKASAVIIDSTYAKECVCVCMQVKRRCMKYILWVEHFGLSSWIMVSSDHGHFYSFYCSTEPGVITEYTLHTEEIVLFMPTLNAY